METTSTYFSSLFSMILEYREIRSEYESLNPIKRLLGINLRKKLKSQYEFIHDILTDEKYNHLDRSISSQELYEFVSMIHSDIDDREEGSTYLSEIISCTEKYHSIFNTIDGTEMHYVMELNIEDEKFNGKCTLSIGSYNTQIDIRYNSTYTDSGKSFNMDITKDEIAQVRNEEANIHLVKIKSVINKLENEFLLDCLNFK